MLVAIMSLRKMHLLIILLLSMLAEVSFAVILMAYFLHLISSSFSLFFQFLGNCSKSIDYESVTLLSIHVSFSHQHHLMIFHWSLIDSKSLQVFKTLLSILANLNNVWVVFAYPPISKSSNHLAKPLGIVPSTLITISYHRTFMLHSFLLLLLCLRFYPSFCFL